MDAGFRALVRSHLALTDEECRRVLAGETRGVLSVIGDNGYPYGMPMNHFYDEQSGCIYFHCGKEGHRVDALRNCPQVSFCVYEQGTRQPGERAYSVCSVIVFGKAELIDDMDEIKRITRLLSYKFTSDEGYIDAEIASAAHRTLLIKLIPEHICGKRVKEA